MSYNPPKLAARSDQRKSVVSIVREALGVAPTPEKPVKGFFAILAAALRQTRID